MSEASNIIGNASANRSNVLSITPPHGQVMDFIHGKHCSDCVSVHSHIRIYYLINW